MSREEDVRRQELEDSMNREIAFRRQLVDLMMQKERLISEARRFGTNRTTEKSNRGT